MSTRPTLAVLGAGSWGTALAALAARNGVPTRLWGRDAQALTAMAQTRRNQRYLPDLELPAELHFESDLATALRGHPKVGLVRYPGLPDDPSHPVAVAQMRRFGGLVAIQLADAAAVHDLVQRSDLLVASTSFGGIHTSVDRRARWGDPVGAGFARISAGIEDTDDLLADVIGALEAG